MRQLNLQPLGNQQRFYWFAVFVLYSWCATAQIEAITSDDRRVLLFEDGTWQYRDSIAAEKLSLRLITNLEIPQTNPDEVVIDHLGYSLLYNEPHEQASWVAYQLTKEKTVKVAERTDKFLVDPMVETESANDKDYAGSGYDRGHLAPAADMSWDATAMAESFYYSNMSPQRPSFNRGIWKRLEELVRSWAVKYQAIYVVTGPVLTPDLPTIGDNEVSIPVYYYKVVLDHTDPEIKGIGFILPNDGSKGLLADFAVSIDSVEAFTGIDFFPKLPDAIEKQLESELCKTCWSW